MDNIAGTLKKTIGAALFLACCALGARCDLPSGLAPANWIETKGGYIKTGITQSGATTVELDCLLEVTSLNYSKRRLMGFDGAGPKNYFGVTTNNHFEIWNPTSITAELGVKYRLHMTQDKTTTLLEVFSEGGEPLDSVTGNAKGINSSECQIFTINSSSAYTCYGIRVYDFKVIIDGDVKRDLVPVFDYTAGKPGMYDSVSGTTLYAYGSGKLDCDALDFHYGSGDTKILLEEGAMYFPSHIGFEDLGDFSFPEGTVLRGTEEGANLTVGEDAMDMRTLFGADMRPGERYPLSVEFTFGLVTNFYIAKSANIPSLFVNLIDADLAFIHRNKKNEAAAVALKIEPDGTSSELLPVKKFAGRGNATWTYSGDKKPYKINLDSKYALIASAPKSKKFALLSLNLQNNKDRSGLKEYAAHELGDAMGMGFNPDSEFVDLYVNGSYRGFYMVKERVTIDPDRININEPKYSFEDEESTTRVVQRNGIKGVKGAAGDPDDGEPVSASSWNVPSPTETITSENDEEDPALRAGIQAYQYATNSRLKTDKEGGAVIEMNACYGQYMQDEHVFFITRRGQIFTLKIPEAATKEQVRRIAVFVQEFEDALFNGKGFNSLGKHYSEYLDVESMAKHVMVDGFMYNSDFCILSTFFYIDADPVSGEFVGKLIAEPIWDYDFAQINSSHIYASNSNPMNYLPQFFSKADFIKALYELQTDPSGFPARVAGLNSNDLSALGDKLQAAHQLNYYRWGSDSLADVATVKSRMSSRAGNWNNIFNPNQKLLGAWVEQAQTRSRNLSGPLTAQTYGAPISYQWYKQDSESGELTELEGETGSTLDQEQYGKGQYVCGVYGKNLEPQAGGTYVTLYTAPYAYGLPEPGAAVIVLALAALLLKRR